ncbi:hemerythrin domain-containing protein [Azospirillum sp. sgz302134]
MTDALTVIKTEHRNLMRVVNLFDVVLREAEPDFALLTAIVDYLQQFPDTYHHPKEDLFLFKALRERDPDAAGILDELEAEHDLCLKATTGLRAALKAYKTGASGGAAAFRKAAEEYRRLQLRHLQKEEGVVMPMAKRALHPEDWAEINAAFADNKDPLFSDEAQEDSRALYSRVVNLAPAPYGLADGH